MRRAAASTARRAALANCEGFSGPSIGIPQVIVAQPAQDSDLIHCSALQVRALTLCRRARHRRVRSRDTAMSCSRERALSGAPPVLFHRALEGELFGATPCFPSAATRERYTDGTNQGRLSAHPPKQKPRLSGAFLQSGRQVKTPDRCGIPGFVIRPCIGFRRERTDSCFGLAIGRQSALPGE